MYLDNIEKSGTLYLGVMGSIPKLSKLALGLKIGLFVVVFKILKVYLYVSNPKNCSQL